MNVGPIVGFGMMIAAHIIQKREKDERRRKDEEKKRKRNAEIARQKGKI